MISLSDPHAVQALLRRHGFHFSKAMGQNFIVDSTVCPRMAAQCGADGETGVLEIGATPAPTAEPVPKPTDAPTPAPTALPTPETFVPRDGSVG